MTTGLGTDVQIGVFVWHGGAMSLSNSLILETGNALPLALGADVIVPRRRQRGERTGIANIAQRHPQARSWGDGLPPHCSI